MDQKINIDKVIETASNAIGEIKSNIGSANLTNEEIGRLLGSALKAELQAYKTKIGLELQALSKPHPEMTSREILINMLALLPNDIPKKFLPILTEYVVHEWDGLRGKMAA